MSKHEHCHSNQLVKKTQNQGRNQRSEHNKISKLRIVYVILSKLLLPFDKTGINFYKMIFLSKLIIIM
jgi:hypothetical protein